MPVTGCETRRRGVDMAATAGVTIREVATKRDRKTFVDLPFRLYRDDPNWVPPL